MYGIDHIPQLVEQSIENVNKGNSDIIASDVLKLIGIYSLFISHDLTL